MTVTKRFSLSSSVAFWLSPVSLSVFCTATHTSNILAISMSWLVLISCISFLQPLQYRRLSLPSIGLRSSHDLLQTTLKSQCSIVICAICAVWISWVEQVSNSTYRKYGTKVKSHVKIFLYCLCLGQSSWSNTGVIRIKPFSMHPNPYWSRPKQGICF